MGWEKTGVGNLVFYQCREMNDSGIVQAFSSKNCGNMALHTGDTPAVVVANRERFLDALGLNLKDMVAATQIHGVTIRNITHDLKGAGADDAESALPGVDGLITREPGVVLTIYTADCLPVFLYDPLTPAVGMAHAGWRGTLDKVALLVLEALVHEFGTDPKVCLAALGPAINLDCFTVTEETAERFYAYSPHSVLTPVYGINKEYRVDLNRFNIDLLTSGGIKPESIFLSEWCTSCRKDEFFSYRAEKGTTGRMMGLMSLRDPNLCIS